MRDITHFVMVLDTLKHAVRSGLITQAETVEVIDRLMEFMCRDYVASEHAQQRNLH